MEQLLSSPRGHSEWDPKENSLEFLLLDTENGSVLPSASKEGVERHLKFHKAEKSVMSLSLDEIFQENALNLDDLFRNASHQHSGLEQAFSWEGGSECYSVNWESLSSGCGGLEQVRHLESSNTVGEDLISLSAPTSPAASPAHSSTSTRMDNQDGRQNSPVPLADLFQCPGLQGPLRMSEQEAVRSEKPVSPVVVFSEGIVQTPLSNHNGPLKPNLLHSLTTVTEVSHAEVHLPQNPAPPDQCSASSDLGLKCGEISGDQVTDLCADPEDLLLLGHDFFPAEVADRKEFSSVNLIPAPSSTTLWMVSEEPVCAENCSLPHADEDMRLKPECVDEGLLDCESDPCSVRHTGTPGTSAHTSPVSVSPSFLAESIPDTACPAEPSPDPVAFEWPLSPDSQLAGITSESPPETLPIPELGSETDPTPEFSPEKIRSDLESEKLPSDERKMSKESHTKNTHISERENLPEVLCESGQNPLPEICGLDLTELHALPEIDSLTETHLQSTHSQAGNVEGVLVVNTHTLSLNEGDHRHTQKTSPSEEAPVASVSEAVQEACMEREREKFPSDDPVMENSQNTLILPEEILPGSPVEGALSTLASLSAACQVEQLTPPSVNESNQTDSSPLTYPGSQTDSSPLTYPGSQTDSSSLTYPGSQVPLLSVFPETFSQSAELSREEDIRLPALHTQDLDTRVQAELFQETHTETDVPQVTHTETDLTQITHTETDLTQETHTETDIPQVTHTETDIPQVTHTETDLTQITLTETDLTQETHTETDLTQETHTETDLTQITHTETDLTQETHTETDLTQETHTETDLTQITHTETDIPQVTHTEKDLTQETHTETDVTQETHTETDLTQITHTETDLTQETHTETDIPQVTHTETDLTQETHTETDLTQITHTETDLTQETHTETDIPKETHTETDIPQVTHTETDIPQVTHTETDIPQVTRTETDLTQVTHTETDLTQETHTETDVTQGTHTVTDLTPETHTETDLTQETHTETDLTQVTHKETDLTQETHTEKDLTQETHTETDLTQKTHTETDLTQETHTETDLTQVTHTQAASDRDVSACERCAEEEMSASLMWDRGVINRDRPGYTGMAQDLSVGSESFGRAETEEGNATAGNPQDNGNDPAALRAVFQALDQDGDGFVRIEEFMEFATAYGAEQVKGLMRYLDPSGLGVISFEDFHRGIVTISNGGCDPDRPKLDESPAEAGGPAEEYDEQAEVSDSVYLGSESAYSECETFTDEDTGALVHPELHEDVETDSGIENTLTENDDSRNRFSLGSDLHGHTLMAVIGGEEEHFEDFGESHTSDLLLAGEEESKAGERAPDRHTHPGSPVHPSPMLLSPSPDAFPASFQSFLQSESVEFFCTHCHRQISRLEDLSTRLHLLEMNSSTKRLSSKKAARLLQSSCLEGMGDLSHDVLDLMDSDLTDKVLLLERRVCELEKDSLQSEEQHVRLKQENLTLVHRANALEEQLKEQELRAEENLHMLVRKHRDTLAKLQRERDLELENLQARLQQLDEENSELRSCVPCLRANIERLEEEKRKLQDEVDHVTERLNEEMDSRRKMGDRLSHERHSNQKEKECTQELIEDLRKQLEQLQLFKLETEARRGRSPSAGLQEYNTRTRENELEQEIRRLKQDNRSLKEQNDELNGQIINLSIQGAKSLVSASFSESLAAEINSVSRSELMEAIQKQEEINYRLQDYIDRIIVAIMESNPSILEVK